MDEMDEIVQEFLVESHENLDQLDRDLVALEQDPGSRERLSSIFRTIHTIKGTSGFLAFGKLEAVTHVGENLLSKLRDGALELTPIRTDVLLRMVDTVRGLLAVIEQTGGEGDAAIEDVVAAISAVLEDQPAPAEDEDADACVDATATSDVDVVDVDVAEPVAPVVPLAVVPPVQEAAPEAEVVAHPVPEQPARLGEILVESGAATPEAVAEAVAEQLRGDERPIGELLVEAGTAEPAEVEAALTQQAEQQTRRSVADSTIRVDVDLLDALMRLVGELVLTRNQILQHTSMLATQVDLVRASQRLNLIASELQEGVMKTRMQPIDHIWQKMPRVVRDLGHQCGKQVRLVMEGRETELDKTLLEAVKDPLTHLVRNSVDHGIETPAERVAKGKPAQGTLTLRSFHEGGQVVVEVSDDGGGIDPAKVGAKAVERGLVGPEQLARMSQRDVLDLIFQPGFSTAAAVTNVSGRGVGMDVVRTNIEKIGGTVDLSSAVGQGTTVRVKIPLTLAIIPALVVGQGGDRYAIPQASLLELVRLEGEAARTGIEHVAGAPVFRLRGQLLPLVHLGDVLGRPKTVSDASSEESGAGEDRAVNVVVLQAGDAPFGLVVDEVSDTQEIVVKPLGRQLKHLSVFAGATIMGDGKVALILDVMGLAAESHALRSAAGSGSSALADDAALDDELTTLLVVAAGGSRLAVPLSSVSRLEEVPAQDIERAGGREVVQYRGSLLPLVHLSRALGNQSYSSSDEADVNRLLPVVVHGTGADAVGLVVEEILDIAEEHLVLSDVGRAAGVLGSAVVQGRVTDLLDVDAVTAAVRPRSTPRATAAAAPTSHSSSEDQEVAGAA
ncbi:MAG: chemotaxis protein CheW [Motilibacteraceae bacterium]